MIRGSSQWLGLNMDWGCSTTAAWKKGGHFACGAGGAAMLMCPPTGGEQRPGDSIHTDPAQKHYDGQSDGGPCGGEHKIPNLAGRWCCTYTNERICLRRAARHRK